MTKPLFSFLAPLGYMAAALMLTLSLFVPLTAKADAFNDAACISVNVPSSITAGKSYTARVVMRNTGSSAWQTGTYHLASQNYQSSAWGPSQVNLTGTVAPDADGVFNFNGSAPSQVGTFTLSWQMQQDGYGSFGQQCSASVTVVNDQGTTVPNYIPTTPLYQYGNGYGYQPYTSTPFVPVYGQSYNCIQASIDGYPGGGYIFDLDGGRRLVPDPSGTITFSNVPVGVHAVRVTQLPGFDPSGKSWAKQEFVLVDGNGQCAQVHFTAQQYVPPVPAPSSPTPSPIPSYPVPQPQPMPQYHPILPQTGAGYMGALEDTAHMLSPMNGSSGGVPAFAVFSLMLAAIGGVGFAARSVI